MTEEDSIFDPTLKKKKKKKKTFDIDAALAEGDTVESAPSAADELFKDDVDDLDLDLKKKKKKKKTFNLDDLDNALPDKEEGEGEGGNQDDVAMDDNFDLELDFSKAKKKKKKKKDLDELMAEADDKQEDKENVDESSVQWMSSDRDYTYEELLNRVFEIMRDKNPDMVAGKKQKFVMKPPQVVRIGTKKTSFANFTEICKTLHRQPKHLLDFLLAELGTSGSVDGNSQLIIKGRFQQKQIENVLRRYIKEYVTCHTCRSPDTILQKDTRLFFLQCETCGSRCSVASIKSGFQAVTSKRAAIRAKTA
ncbi:PREDICTED: eukaryotic translation initiation factor 2 subunit 2 isoform X2 [Nicrophorus vespilloides]|uniref:Eukaryotic translation initiation factor 2 subunit 2 n=1 Tax=Nicrophorus vespilloides TaxID=110193 RepID=A0ABM1MJG7_NICVS|nr:PREDICTED: eukaryotic translation initiation factor 2 subunit 2 isoform X2 [Nicrophorus vespilloides]